MRQYCQSNVCIHFFLITFVCVSAANVLANDHDGVLQPLAPWQGREVTSLSIEGMPNNLGDTVTKGLALTPRRKLLKHKYTKLQLTLAQADAARIRLILAKNGFPYASISATGEADGDTGVRVTFLVDPGSVVFIGKVTVLGIPSTLNDIMASIVQELPAGSPLVDHQALLVQDQIELELLNAGYAQPNVSLELVLDESSTCDLIFSCIPGNTFKYKQLLVEGIPENLVPLVHRTVDLKPGSLYSPAIAADARRYLRKLQLFRQVRLHSEAQDSTTLNLLADLHPRRMITANFSIGSFTDNWIVAKAGISHRNFFHRGIGTGLNASYANHLQEIRARIFWHSLLIKRSQSEFDVGFKILDEDSYRLEKSTIGVSSLLETWQFSSLRFGLSVSNGVLENRSVDSTTFTDDVGLQTVLSGTWFQDTSDSPLDPNKGHRFTLQSDWSPPGFWTDSPFVSFRAVGCNYLSLGEKSTLATRIDGGVAWPLGESNSLSPDRRWFAGGVSTMRGYKRQKLGPYDSEGKPVGGQARLLASCELRLPLWSIIGVAFFVDSGQVWSNRHKTSLDNFAVAGGFGLLIGTPIGPVRLDLAHNLTEPANNLPDTVLQLGIGHPF